MYYYITKCFVMNNNSCHNFHILLFILLRKPKRFHSIAMLYYIAIALYTQTLLNRFWHFKLHKHHILSIYFAIYAVSEYEKCVWRYYWKYYSECCMLEKSWNRLIHYVNLWNVIIKICSLKIQKRNIVFVTAWWKLLERIYL